MSRRRSSSWWLALPVAVLVGVGLVVAVLWKRAADAEALKQFGEDHSQYNGNRPELYTPGRVPFEGPGYIQLHAKIIPR